MRFDFNVTCSSRRASECGELGKEDKGPQGHVGDESLRGRGGRR